MKLKIRVVSIILCTAMLIGLLPAEQVFAATNLGPNFGILGFTDDAKGIAITFNEKDSNVSSLKYTKESSWTKIDDFDSVISVKGKEDSLENMVANSDYFNFKPSTWAYYNAINAASAWSSVRASTAPIRWDNVDSNRMSSIMLGRNKLSDPSSLVNFLTKSESDGGLGFINGDISIYYSECYWVDTERKFSTNENILKKISDAGKSWYYQRIACDYNATEDLFVYNLVGILQHQGDDNMYILAQYTSKYLIEFGVVPFQDESDESDVEDVCSLQKKFDSAINAFWKNSEYRKALAAKLQSLYTDNVQLKSHEDQLSNPILTINNVLSIEDGAAVGAPWVESVGLDYYLGLFITSSKLSKFVNETTFGCNITTTGSATNMNAECSIKYDHRVHIVKWYVNGDQAGDIIVPIGNFESFIKTGFNFISDGIAGMSYRQNLPSGINISHENFGMDDAYPKCFTISSSVKVSASSMAWQTTLSKSVGSAEDAWGDLLVQAYSMYSAVTQDDINFVYASSSEPVELKYYVDNPGTAPESIRKHPFYNAFLAICEAQIKVDYNSNTGVNIALGLEYVIKDGKLTIAYTPNDILSSELNWKTILDKEFVGEALTVSTAADLMYCLMYLQYLCDNEGYNFPLNSVDIIVEKDKKVMTILYSDVAINSFPLTLGYFWDDENQLGRSMPKSSTTEWTYVNSADNLLKTLGSTGLMSHSTASVLLNTYNTAYIKLTGNSIYNTSTKLITNVDSHKDLGIYAMFGYDEGTVDATRNRMETVKGTELFTGHVLGVLSDAQFMYTYATLLSIGQIGPNSATAMDDYQKWNYFSSNVYSRAENLQGTKYANEEESSIDYFPRLPVLDVKFPASVYTFLYNVEYAAAVCDWSTLSDSMGIDVNTVESFLYSASASNTESMAEIMKGKLVAAYDQCATSNLTVYEWAKSGVYDGVNDDYMGILRSIVNIHNLCDLLWSANETYLKGSVPTDIAGKGIDIAKNWSPVIYGYYMIYEKDPELFNALSKNLVNYIAEEFSYSTPIEPLGFVIKFEDEQLSAQWKYGYALSSMYVPFQTNVYEVAAIEEKADDTEWVTNFYYKYGFYRKALYITTDPNAVVDRYASGVYSPTKVATLRDLLNYNRDIELYVDQGFYNAGMLEEQLDRYIQNTNEGSVFGSIFDACNLTPESILKTGGYATYSSAIQAKVRPFGYEIAEAEKDAAAEMFAYEDFILSEDDILGEKGMLSAYDYTIQQPYGLVSAVYRSGTLFNTANRASVENKPVFVSSKNANAIGSYNKDLYRCFYNYLMLSAMEETIERETTLLVDLDAPIFIDIFGNIVTADGYVIIPAASNPTLAGENWVPYTIGFATYVNNAKPEAYEDMTYEFYDFLYGINYAAAIGKTDVDTYSSNFRDNQKEIGGGYFFLRQNGTSTLGTTNLTDGVASTTVNWDNPNTHVSALKSLLFSVHYLNTADMYNMTTVNMILEVLRGAPIEFIDYEAEGISSSHALTKMGATIAYMSEKLMNSVQTDSNGTERNAKFSATLNVLDLFHIESAEKVALIAVKLLLIGFLILLAVQIIADASVGKMPVKTVGRIIVTCVLTGTCIALLPVLTEFSLSKMTQMLLQPEAAELLAMQAQRDSYGVEIGVTESYNTESSTDIIVKVGELDVQWYDLLLYSVYSSVDNSFTDLYNKAADGLPLAEASYTFTSGKNIYMDLSKIMDSTIVQYNGELGLITNERAREKTEEDMSASFLFPYYVFLDQLVANVNMYNKQNGTQPLSYSINSDGSIRTQDMTYAYFHSNEFMTTDYDILDLYRILNVDSYKLSYCSYFSDKDIVNISGSMWYPIKGEVDTEALTKSIEQLYQSARDYVTTNSGMLSYVSDGAYLKSLAMYLAVEYNSIFGVGIADAFELKCVDTKDMLRYTVSNPKDVYKYANRSFSRYAFEVNEEWGAILAASLYVIMCVTNAIKVIAYVMTYTVAVWSIIYHRVFKRESDYSVYGFFILIGEITLLNVIYSVILKVMLNLTRWGVPGITSLVICIILQGLVILGFVALCFNGVKNVKELGQREIHRIQTIINNLNSDRSSRDTSDPNQPERTVAVLQAHDFSRQEQDNYNGDRANVSNLLEHDRRRESGQLGQQAEA